MQLEFFSDIAVFCQQADGYLRQHEAHHNLLLRLCRNLQRQPERYQGEVYLAIVKAKYPENLDQIAAVAIRTPSFPLVLSQATQPAALELIAKDIYLRQGKIPGCSGLVNEAHRFAEAWRAVAQQSYVLKEQRGIYQLDQVQQISPVSGELRHATEADWDLLRQWYSAFELEALGEIKANIDQLITNRLEQNSLYLWQDDIPVTLVGGSGVPADFGWIAPVYTPPEYRRRGYATAAVAAVSHRLLRDCRCCFLFADLHNSTANHIYQTIGYQFICDWHEYEFGN